MKYLFGQGAAAPGTDINSIDSGVYQFGTYAPKSENAMFDTSIDYDTIVSSSLGSTSTLASFGNNPATAIPFGPIGLVNLIPLYLILGNYDEGDKKILKYTYGTAKPNIDIYEEVSDAGNTEKYYVADCEVSSLKLHWELGSSWTAVGTLMGCAHGIYTGVDAVDNGLPVDAQGTPVVVDSDFDTCESPLWVAHALALQSMDINISTPIFGNYGNDGKFRTLNSQVPISGTITFKILGQDSTLRADLGGTERAMTFTMGKSVNDHAAAFTLSNCGLFSYRPTGKENNSRMIYECRATFEDIYAVLSGTNPIDPTTFYWVSQA